MTRTERELILGDEVHEIVGAAMEVHRELGPGFLEAIYQESMQIELSLRGIPHVAQKAIVPMYKDRPLTRYYKPDLGVKIERGGPLAP